jgi:hypothetical protein
MPTQLLECVLVDTWLCWVVHFSSRMSYVSKLVSAAWVELCLKCIIYSMNGNKLAFNGQNDWKQLQRNIVLSTVVHNGFPLGRFNNDTSMLLL